jgi:hypothetical protein
MNKKKQIHSEFKAILELLGNDLPRVKSILKKIQLSQSESKIIRSWMKLRKSDFESALDILMSIPETSDQLIDGEKNLLLGITFNNKSESNLAICYLLKSIESFKKIAVDSELFVAYDNLFVAAYNQRSAGLMKQALKGMNSVSDLPVSYTISKLRANFLLECYLGNYDSGFKLQIQLEDLREKMSESQELSYLISKFDFAVKRERYHECKMVLGELKQIRNFNYGANYKFMDRLVEFYFNDAPLYLYDEHFKNHPILLNMVKLIRSFSEQDLFQAEKAWSALINLCPEIFYPKFEYRGEKNLFSLCFNFL